MANATEGTHMKRLPKGKRAEIANAICERIAKGESLRSICEGERSGDNLYGYPAEGTFRGWVRKDDALNTQYTRACEDRADVIFEQCLSIADNNEGDEHEGEHDHDHINRMRLRIDTRKWMLGKMRPGKYGERVRQEITGKDGGPIETSPSTKLTDFLSGIASRKTS